MTKLHKIEKKHGSIASFKAMILDPELSQAEMEIYVDLLPESDDPQHVFLVSDTSNSIVAANTGVKVDEVEVMM